MKPHNDKPEFALGLAFRNGTETEPFRPNIVEVDFEHFQHFLEDSDMTDAQKHEFLSALWDIMVGFVDLGFGIHPMQQVSEKDIEKTVETFLSKADTKTYSKTNMTEKFSETARGDPNEP